MNMNKLVLLIIITMTSCTKQVIKTKNNVPNEKIIFSLIAKQCMGTCPIYNLKLTSDSVLVYNGLANTPLKGEHMKKLENEEYQEFVTLINSIDWKAINKVKYENGLDLPTKEFYYNHNYEQTVIKKSIDPKVLVDFEIKLLQLIENTIFLEETDK